MPLSTAPKCPFFIFYGTYLVAWSTSFFVSYILSLRAPKIQKEIIGTMADTNSPMP
jgi:hypothetical protein